MKDSGNFDNHPIKSPPFQEACRLFRAVDEEDPRKVKVEGRQVGWSHFYHRRLQYWVTRLDRRASEAVLLAARCQHIRRWSIPRSTYPPGRNGYRRWRRDLQKFHAREAGEILRRAGYPDSMIGRVSDLVQKRRLKLDPEAQLLEDAVCIVFLENQLLDFSRHRSQEAVVEILRKTWNKMSPKGRSMAVTLTGQLRPSVQATIKKALGQDSADRHSDRASRPRLLSQERNRI